MHPGIKYLQPADSYLIHPNTTSLKPADSLLIHVVPKPGVSKLSNDFLQMLQNLYHLILLLSPHRILKGPHSLEELLSDSNIESWRSVVYLLRIKPVCGKEKFWKKCFIKSSCANCPKTIFSDAVK